MGNLNETANWDAGVPYFAADAVLTGGPDCQDNIPIQALTNRTAFLKKQIDDAVSGALVTMTAKKLQTERTITMTGDGAWSAVFDGSGNVSSAMTLKSSIALTGTPTAPTAAQGNNSQQIANTAFVQAAIAALVASSPAALDTLQELAAALGNDANFATTVTNALAGKANKATTLAGYGITDGGSGKVIASLFTSNRTVMAASGDTTAMTMNFTLMQATPVIVDWRACFGTYTTNAVFGSARLVLGSTQKVRSPRIHLGASGGGYVYSDKFSGSTYLGLLAAGSYTISIIWNNETAGAAVLNTGPADFAGWTQADSEIIVRAAA